MFPKLKLSLKVYHFESFECVNGTERAFQKMISTLFPGTT
jgi:hypothetical protein